ncbi:MAG TPA: acyl-CoA thioester hydrolase/BAAT C-terminal domain-containing protein, partial [Rhabdochlamydiaceae bacterium]|nr:acyl-CoA thioester hydrolase/BAAT C-terminal domain-containing protein [Rhabdochlamydiaceae bacterium]
GGRRAVFYLPVSDHPLPVIITLSGSNGGISESRAKLLASEGFATLALGYFGIGGLPSNLENIPLEYFKTAIDWLRAHPAIDRNHIGLYGVSRGAELSLILGTVYPDSIHAIAAAVPSSVVYGAMNHPKLPAWTYQGKPIAPSAPFAASVIETGEDLGQDAEHPLRTTSQFLEGMKDKKAYERAKIPVEKITCPILLISGGDDGMWPSSIFAKQIEQRLHEKNASISIQHLHYPNAGHQIGIPGLSSGSLYFHPIAYKWFSMGGTAEADEAASQDSWEKLVAFFRQG